jgi:hypothetical protein
MTKTVKISLLKETANRMLVDSPNDCINYRQGVINLMQSILMETKNYDGFRYLTKDDVEPEYTVGVHIDNPELTFDFSNTDTTRIFLY